MIVLNGAFVITNSLCTLFVVEDPSEDEELLFWWSWGSPWGAWGDGRSSALSSSSSPSSSSSSSSQEPLAAVWGYLSVECPCWK